MITLMAGSALANWQHLDQDRPSRRKKGKYKEKRSMWYHVAEAFDDLDDLFDIFD